MYVSPPDPNLSVLPLGTYQVATMPTPAVGLLGRTCIVTDLFGNRFSKCRCERITVAAVDYYFWQPLSSDSSGSVDVAGTNVTIPALTTPTSITLSGNILAGVARTVAFDDGAFPGQIKEIRSGGLIGALGSLTLLGTGLGAGVGFLAGGYGKYVSDWSSTPGTKTWVKLV